MFEEEDENLASVIEACRSVTSDKITERRKASEHIQIALSDSRGMTSSKQHALTLER